MLTCLFASALIKENFQISFSFAYREEFERVMLWWWNIAGAECPYFPLKLLSSRFYGNKLFRMVKYVCVPFDAIKIYKLLKQIRPEILVINSGGYPGPISCQAAVLAGRMAKVKKVVYFINNLPKKRNFIQRLIEKPMDNFVSQEVDVMLSASHAVSREIKELFWHRAPAFRVMPNTIHSQLLVDREKVRKSLGVLPEDVLIVCVGVFEKRKGQTYLLKAFRELVQKHGNGVVLLLVGEGKEELALMVESIDIRPVFFRKNVKDGYSYINACDIYVQPSIAHEDFPILVLQAMSLGKPIVGTKVAGMAEQIVDWMNGLLVEPGEVKQLRDCIDYLIEKKASRQMMGMNSQRLFKRYYSYDKIMRKMFWHLLRSKLLWNFPT